MATPSITVKCVSATLLASSLFISFGGRIRPQLFADAAQLIVEPPGVADSSAASSFTEKTGRPRVDSADHRTEGSTGQAYDHRSSGGAVNDGSSGSDPSGRDTKKKRSLGSRDYGERMPGLKTLTDMIAEEKGTEVLNSIRGEKVVQEERYKLTGSSRASSLILLSMGRKIKDTVDRAVSASRPRGRN